MKGITRADSGVSYLRPCLIDNDLSKQQAERYMLINTTEQAGELLEHVPQAPSILLFAPCYSNVNLMRHESAFDKILSYPTTHCIG
jgi:hypothetical protein